MYSLPGLVSLSAGHSDVALRNALRNAAIRDDRETTVLQSFLSSSQTFQEGLRGLQIRRLGVRVPPRVPTRTSVEGPTQSDLSRAFWLFVP